MKEKEGLYRPFILYPRQSISQVRSCVLENFGKIKYELPFINALCVNIPHEKIKNIKVNKRVAAVTEDIQVSKLECTGKQSAQTGDVCPFPDVPAKERVSIAVIDTGVAPHYDLIFPCNRIRYFEDFVNHRPLPYDDDGHGTHVAGIALGNGYLCHTCHGTAPEADLIALKALDMDGNGNVSDILAAMQWIFLHHILYNIKVVNLSLGVLSTKKNEIDPLLLGAEALVHAGVCVVAAAGNSGPGKKTVTSPGISPLVLTVGACDEEGSIPDFSSRGPASYGIHKPDIVAPGVDIRSLSAENPKEYTIQSGTSMSAPFAAGLAARYCAAHPKAAPHEVKSAILHLARPIRGADLNAQGHGALLCR